jgi:16S rRNA (cytosine967-C5)-methyltransferase
MQLAATGANGTAVDRSAKRLRLVKQNLERTGLEADCVTADATHWDSQRQFDAVLVDAPCSALGTLRRHPEGPWIKSLKDLTRFPDIQARLLRAASGMVKPGGRLVYCVCTPLSREGVDIVDAFLADAPDWQRKPISADVCSGFEEALTPAGDLLTLPGGFEGPGGCDAFYIARLEHNSD